MIPLGEVGALAVPTYGNEMREFDATGLMRRRYASINDARIEASERRL